jgi:hypothetical protein
MDDLPRSLRVECSPDFDDTALRVCALSARIPRVTSENACGRPAVLIPHESDEALGIAPGPLDVCVPDERAEEGPTQGDPKARVEAIVQARRVAHLTRIAGYDDEPDKSAE